MHIWPLCVYICSIRPVFCGIRVQISPAESPTGLSNPPGFPYRCSQHLPKTYLTSWCFLNVQQSADVKAEWVTCFPELSVLKKYHPGIILCYRHSQTVDILVYMQIICVFTYCLLHTDRLPETKLSDILAQQDCIAGEEFYFYW